ncbi:GAK6 protein, partial [Nicator chloris]|nr:GAK6 protein [Nicator chloris]
ANTDCKTLLKSLPSQEPTLIEMIEACNHIGKIKHQYEAMAAAFGAIEGSSEISRVCFSCSQPGHLKKDCFSQK